MKANACADASLLLNSQDQESACVNRMLIIVYPEGMLLDACVGTMTLGQSLGRLEEVEVVAEGVESPALPLVEVVSAISEVLEVVNVFAKRVEEGTKE